MNIRYLGTRLNKRQIRGSATGKRYRYSSGQPVFTIDPADRTQFAGEMEDGKRKFRVLTAFEYAFADVTFEEVSLEVMEPEGVVNRAIRGVIGHLEKHPELSREDLEDIMLAEIMDQDRVGAKAAIKKAIDALP